MRQIVGYKDAEGERSGGGEPELSPPVPPFLFLSWETTTARIDRRKKLISVAFYPPCASSPDLQRWGGVCAKEFTITQSHVLVLTSRTLWQFSALADLYNP